MTDIYSSTVFFESLTFEQNDEEFGNYHNLSIRRLNLCVGIIMIITDLYYFTDPILYPNVYPSYLFYVYSILLVIDSLSLFLLMKFKVNTFWNKVGSYLRTFFILRGAFLIVLASTAEIPASERKIGVLEIFFVQMIELLMIFITNIYAKNVEGVIYFIIYFSATLYISLTTPDKPYEYAAECIFCVGCLVIFYFKNQYHIGLIRSFNEWKRNQQLTLYYKQFIDNLHMQTCTLINNKVVMHNKAFKDSAFNNANSHFILTDINDDINQTSLCLKTQDTLYQKYLSEFYYIEECNGKQNNTLIDVLNDFINDAEILPCFNFVNVGTFTDKDNKSFYDISIRKLKFSTIVKESIIDIIINDFTKVKEAENISSETKIKHKLFSKLAHEFKTPVLVIKSLSQEMTTISNKNDLIVITDQINNLSDYVTFLINDIIYYTNNETIGDFRKQAVDINEILIFSSNVCRSLLSVFNNLLVKIETILDVDPSINDYIIYSDKIRLEQVMLNFISNSVKFTKKGSIRISAQVQKIEFDNGCLCNNIILCVKDTGIGISKEDLERIRYDSDSIRLNINKTYNEMGSGLGLDISKSILKRLDHPYEIYSCLDEGTEIKVIINSIELKTKKTTSSLTMPYMDRPSFNFSTTDIFKNSGILRNSSLIDNENSLSINKENLEVILVVEDNKYIRNSTVTMINNYYSKHKNLKALEVVSCNDGVDALYNIKIDHESGRNRIKYMLIDENME